MPRKGSVVLAQIQGQWWVPGGEPKQSVLNQGAPRFASGSKAAGGDAVPSQNSPWTGIAPIDSSTEANMEPTDQPTQQEEAADPSFEVNAGRPIWAP